MKPRNRSPWVRRIAGGGAIVGAGFFLLLILAHTVFFTPQRLVSILEKKFNCRASVDEVTLTLWSNPSRLEVRGLQLFPRTEESASQKQTSPAAPRQNPTPLVSVRQLRLDVAFLSLLVGQIDIRELSATGVVASMTMLADGDSDLELLFADPEDIEKARREGAGRKRKKRGYHDFTVDTLPLPAHCQSAFLDDLRFDIHLPARHKHIRCEEVSLRITDLDVNRRHLDKHNHAKVTLDGKIRVDDTESRHSYGTAVLRAHGQATPFDPTSRVFIPSVTFQVDLLEGSHLNAMPLLDALASKLKLLEAYGVDLGDLDLEGDLEREALVRLQYKDELFTLTEDTRLEFADYRLAMQKGSWFNADDDQHRFVTGITASESLTARALSRVDRFVEEKLNMRPAPFRELIAEHLLEDDRLTLRFETSGDLGAPEVDLVSELPDLGQVLNKLSRDFLKSLFD